MIVATAGLSALYADAIRTPFLNDDYLFLEDVRSRSLAESLVHLGALGNYYRPLSRQIYFAVLGSWAGGSPLVFHLFNFAVFLGALMLVADLLRAMLPQRGVLAGTLFFALLPFQRVNLIWISCSQDLLALLGALAAFALWRRGRTVLALVAFAVGVTSKETALALPAALVAWSWLVERNPITHAIRRAAPFAVLAVAWLSIALFMRGRHAVAAPLDWNPAALVAACVHLGQSLLGLDHPPGFFGALAANGPALLPLLFLVALAVWYAPDFVRRPRSAAEPAPADSGLEQSAGGARSIPTPRVVAFAAVWLVAFTVPVWPVVYAWSSYYYTLAAVGGAVVLGLAFSRGDAWTWLALSAGLLWWHAGTTNTQAFAVRNERWTWTSHLTTFYLQRAAALTDSMSVQMRRIVPQPEPGSRFFFATLQPWAGFQMGNGALIRTLYRDSTLASYFYSQFSESTAANRTCHILWWDGREFAPLYAGVRDPWFQVGSDLLLLDKPAGARHAFQRGLAAGGDRMDLLYWLGWAELWTGSRERAEAAWKAFGARDDSLVWSAHLRTAHNALTDGDTLESRRQLVKAIEYGIGRPEAHAVLGELMVPRAAKYGLLELKVASWLNPRDWWARRHLVAGLANVRLDDSAAREFEALLRDFPDLERDSLLSEARRRYQTHSGATTRVVTVGGN